jgi:WD40 repeat protein
MDTRYRSVVRGTLLALLIALPTAPISAQAVNDPLPATKPLGEPLSGPTDFIAPKFVAAHFSADGKTVLTAYGEPDKTGGKGIPKLSPIAVRLWDAATGKPLGKPLSFTLKGAEKVLVALHDKTVVTVHSTDKQDKDGAGAKSVMQSWNAATGKSAWGPVTVDGYVNVVKLSPEGKTIVTSASGGRLDQVPRSTRLWDAANGKAIGDPLVLLKSSMFVGTLLFSPDGKNLLTMAWTSTKTEFRLWDVATGKPRAEPRFHIKAVSGVAFSPDGKTLLTAAVVQKELIYGALDAATFKPIGEPLRLPFPGFNPLQSTVVYSPDARTVLDATREKSAQLWDVVTGKTIGEALPHPDQVYRAAFSPNGKVLLTASGSFTKPKEVRLWDVTKSKAICTVPNDSYIEAAEFSPDGTVLLLAPGGSAARLWQVPKLPK